MPTISQKVQELVLYQTPKLLLCRSGYKTEQEILVVIQISIPLFGVEQNLVS